MSFDPEELRKSLRGNGEDESEAESPEKHVDASEDDVAASEADSSKAAGESSQSVKGRLIGAPDDPSGRSTSTRSARETPLIIGQPEPEHREYQSQQTEYEGPGGSEGGFDSLRDVLLDAGTRAAAATLNESAAEEIEGADHDEESEASKPGKKRRKYLPVTSPSPLSWLALIGGGVALAGTLAAITMDVGGDGALLGLITIGVVLVAGFLVVNRRWLRVSLSGRSARYSANVATVIISLLGVLILINILGYRYHYRLDLSSGRFHSLSPQSIQALENIDRAGETVTITAFSRTTDGYRPIIEDLVDRYLYRSRNLEFSFVDPDIQREFAESKGVERYPSLLFELGDHRKSITDIDEAHFTSALIAVRKTQLPIIAFLAGHNEPDPFSEHRSVRAVSFLREQLELENHEIILLRIPESNGVPPETSVLLVISPQGNLQRQEINAISDYLDEGGNLVCLLEPGKDAGLAGLLAQYGINLNDGIVLDDTRNFFGELSSPVLVGDPEHSITSPSRMDTQLLSMVFLHAGSLDYTTTSRLSGVRVESLIRSWDSSWSETGSRFEYNEGIDEKGSQEMALLATRNLEGDATVASDDDSDSPFSDTDEQDDSDSESGNESPEHVSQVLVVNDASFVQNANFEHYDNRDFIMNAISYLTSRHDLITIRPTERAIRKLELSPAQANTIFAFSVVLTPLLIACAGGWVWWRRR